MKLDLINKEEDRQYIIENSSKTDLIDMLKQYGKVIDYFTEPMVAEFYGVGNKAINSYANRNKEELEKYGYKAYKKSEILKLQCEGLENIPNRGLRLYPIQAVIIIGMMLTESEVAEKLRSDIIKRIFNPKTEISTVDNTELFDKIDRQGKTINELLKMVKDLSNKIDNLSINNTPKIDTKNNINNDFNYSRYLNHINNLLDTTHITKKEFINLINSYDFLNENIGITVLNNILNNNNLIFGNDRLTDYAKENNILIRDTYKNHNKVFLTKKGILYISNIIINSTLNDYKIKRK